MIFGLLLVMDQSMERYSIELNRRGFNSVAYIENYITRIIGCVYDGYF